jgi:hypothetical protein
MTTSVNVPPIDARALHRARRFVSDALCLREKALDDRQTRSMSSSVRGQDGKRLTGGARLKRPWSFPSDERGFFL